MVKWATATTADIQTIQLQRFGAMSLNTSKERTGDIALCLFVERQVTMRRLLSDDSLISQIVREPFNLTL